MSSSGQYVIAATTTGMYYSIDYGATWTQSANTDTYIGCALSGDGTIGIAANSNNDIQISTNIPPQTVTGYVVSIE